MDKCSYTTLLDNVILKDNSNLSLQSRILMRNEILEKSKNKISDWFCILVYIFIIIANTLRIVGINKTKQNNNNNNNNNNNINNERSIIKDLFYLTSLLGVFTGILATFIVFGKFFLECSIEYIAMNLERIAKIFDFFVLVCISVVRFISLRYPFKEIKRQRIRLALGLYLFYIVSLALCSFLLKYVLKSSGRRISTQYKMVALFIVICLTLNCFSVFILQYSLLKESKKNEHLNNQSIERQRKAVKRLTLINSVYLVFNLPYVIYLQDSVFRIESRTAEELAWRVDRHYTLYYFSFVYSGISAIIYIAWDKDIVNFYKGILRKMRRQKHQVKTDEF